MIDNLPENRLTYLYLDTIDLQNTDSPSAKDHTRQPTHPAPLGDGPPAPHQAIALKNAVHDGLDLHTRSPRASQDLSGKELQLLHEDSGNGENDGVHGDHRDGHGLHRRRDSSGSNGDEGDLGEADGDDDLDDDMMDKISSSPSINDGRCLFPLHWPSREDSLPIPQTPVKYPQSLTTSHNNLSSSRFLSMSVHPSCSWMQQDLDQWASEVHHHWGKSCEKLPKERPQSTYSDGDENRDELTPLFSDQRAIHFGEEVKKIWDAGAGEFESEDLHKLLLPADDPLLDNSFDDTPLSLDSPGSSSSNSNSSWDNQSEETADDETEDISYIDDSRFVDLGWGGECLREIDEIDFDFVYALHTFIATVEGQANASKGDTMTLLDDSNSYWWLVRVLKDNSIGNHDPDSAFEISLIYDKGYLPAEHIETPVERVARFNKHRNIDVICTCYR